jgi:hypothetical protein
LTLYSTVLHSSGQYSSTTSVADVVAYCHFLTVRCEPSLLMMEVIALIRA